MKNFFLLGTLFLGVISSRLSADNFYVGGFAGANYIQDNSDIRDHYDMGYMLGCNVGYRWQCSWWRIEGEYGYRKSRIKHRRKEHHSGASVDAHQIYYNGMGNIYYDFFLPNTWLTPYIGGGVGWYEQKFRYEQKPAYPDEGIKTGVAWQLLAGLSYEINCMWSCNLTYRMLKPCKERFYNHGLTGGVRYDF